MTNEQIIHDLQELKQFFEEQSGGCFPLSLEYAVKIISENHVNLEELERKICKLHKVEDSDGQEYVMLYDVLETIRRMEVVNNGK